MYYKAPKRKYNSQQCSNFSSVMKSCSYQILLPAKWEEGARSSSSLRPCPSCSQDANWRKMMVCFPYFTSAPPKFFFFVMLWSEKQNKRPVSLREFLNTASLFACQRTAPCWHFIHRPGSHLRKQSLVVLSLQLSYLLKHYQKNLLSSKSGNTVLLSSLWQMRRSPHTPGSNALSLLLNQEPEVFSFLWVSENYSDHTPAYLEVRL